MKLIKEWESLQPLYNQGFRFNPEDETFFALDTKKFKHPEGYEEWKVQKFDKDKYLKETLSEMGVTDAQNEVEIIGKDGNKMKVPVFTSNQHGDIEILQYSLKRQAHLYEKKSTSAGTTFEYCVQKRLNSSYAMFCEGKYDFTEAKNTPFWHPDLIQAFEDKTEVDTLVITEGQKKAWKATQDGILTVGLTSINHFREKSTQELHTEILEFIHVCKVKNVVILWDGDCRNISSKSLEKQENIEKRPHSFYSFAKSIRESLYKVNKQKKLSVFHATIRTADIEGEPKGIDDLLQIKSIASSNVKLDFDRIGQIPGYYIQWINISTDGGVKEMRSFYYLDSVHKFYQHHVDLIKGKNFVFFGNTYRVEKGLPIIEVSADLKEYKLIGCDWYRLLWTTVPNGKKGETVLEERLTPWKPEIIKLKHGKDSLSKIEAYNGFTNIPNHLDYLQVINNEWNLYSNVKHEKKEGEFPTIRKLLKHVFQEHYDNDMIIDYITILYKEPMQKLPIIALLSAKQGTGKSTFIYLMKLIFKQNMAIISNNEITGDFNSHWSAKLIAACEETVFDKKEAYEKLKALTTQKSFMRNEKNKSQSEIPCMLHFILCSNHEDDFMKISKYDRRLWVRKVDEFKKKEEDADVTFDARLEAEIPAFVHFIENREITYKEVGELYFHQRDFQTNAFFNLVDHSEPGIVKDIKEALLDSFMKYGGRTRELTASDLQQYFKIKGEVNYINKVVKTYFNAERIKNLQGKEYVRNYSFLIDDFSNPTKSRTISAKGRPFVFRDDMILSADLMEYTHGVVQEKLL